MRFTNEIDYNHYICYLHQFNCNNYIKLNQFEIKLLIYIEMCSFRRANFLYIQLSYYNNFFSSQFKGEPPEIEEVCRETRAEACPYSEGGWWNACSKRQACFSSKGRGRHSSSGRASRQERSTGETLPLELEIFQDKNFSFNFLRNFIGNAKWKWKNQKLINKFFKIIESITFSCT